MYCMTARLSDDDGGDPAASEPDANVAAAAADQPAGLAGGQAAGQPAAQGQLAAGTRQPGITWPRAAGS